MDVLVRIDPADTAVHVVGKVDPVGWPTFVGRDLYLSGNETVAPHSQPRPSPLARNHTKQNRNKHNEKMTNAIEATAGTPISRRGFVRSAAPSRSAPSRRNREPGGQCGEGGSKRAFSGPFKCNSCALGNWRKRSAIFQWSMCRWADRMARPTLAAGQRCPQSPCHPRKGGGTGRRCSLPTGLFPRRFPQAVFLSPVLTELFERLKKTGFRVILGVSGHNVQGQIDMIDKRWRPWWPMGQSRELDCGRSPSVRAPSRAPITRRSGKPPT